jgi:hypothetical protein
MANMQVIPQWLKSEASALRKYSANTLICDILLSAILPLNASWGIFFEWHFS